MGHHRSEGEVFTFPALQWSAANFVASLTHSTSIPSTCRENIPVTASADQEALISVPLRLCAVSYMSIRQLYACSHLQLPGRASSAASCYSLGPGRAGGWGVQPTQQPPPRTTQLPSDWWVWVSPWGLGWSLLSCSSLCWLRPSPPRSPCRTCCSHRWKRTAASTEQPCWTSQRADPDGRRQIMSDSVILPPLFILTLKMVHINVLTNE